jgi:hypothetical protein
LEKSSTNSQNQIKITPYSQSPKSPLQIPYLTIKFNNNPMPKPNLPPKQGHLPLLIALMLLSTMNPVFTKTPYHQPNPTNPTLPTTQPLLVRFYNFYQPTVKIIIAGAPVSILDQNRSDYIIYEISDPNNPKIEFKINDTQESIDGPFIGSSISIFVYKDSFGSAKMQMQYDIISNPLRNVQIYMDDAIWR